MHALILKSYDLHTDAIISSLTTLITGSSMFCVQQHNRGEHNVHHGYDNHLDIGRHIL